MVTQKKIQESLEIRFFNRLDRVLISMRFAAIVKRMSTSAQSVRLSAALFNRAEENGSYKRIKNG